MITSAWIPAAAPRATGKPPRGGSCGGIRLAMLLAALVFPAPTTLLRNTAIAQSDRAPASSDSGAADGDSWPKQIEADWAAQQRRRGQTTDSPRAVREAWQRGHQLLSDLRRALPPAALQPEAAELCGLQDQVERAETLTPERTRALYHQLRWTTRQLALKNPLLAGKPLVFMKRRRFVSQMLHEYLGYYYDYGDVAGGGVFLLDEPGRSPAVRDLIAGRLPRGNYTTLALDYDARTIYFAFAERAAEKKPDFYSPQRRSFHLYALAADGSQLRKLTDGTEDDFDPCPLPDGGLAFMSSRRGGFGRCHNPWEPLPAYTLHRMNADGSEIRTLSWHETNEWHPAVLNDGRIVYSRWDYVDRSAANFHGLWTTHADGSNPAVLFGNYTLRINACFQPHAIPGSDKILFVAGAHHADVGGSLVLLDPRRIALQPGSGEDSLAAIEALTPDVTFPEANGWPASYFHSPWPLAENYLLVAFSFDPLPGMSSGEQRDTRTGLYYFDRFGNLELLYRDAEASCMYPIPLAPRPAPPQVAAAAKKMVEDTAVPATAPLASAELPWAETEAPDASVGEFLLTDVRESFLPLPPERAIAELRIYQVLPKTHSHVANQPRIGYANAESARMLLGTVPVEADGSAYFRAPAGKPLYFQAVDARGRAVQTMRSVTYLQPGERRGCVGCHERPGTAAANRPLLAAARGPSPIAPGPPGTRPLSFPLLVQPVLDRHCVPCHDGQSGPNNSPLALTGQVQGEFSRSYQNLRPFVRWNEWGGASLNETVTHPGRGGADHSPLARVLDDGHHAPALRLTAADRLRLDLWLDANAPFYGTYTADERQAQLRGETVPPPRVQ
jgi:hypothetical protein